MMREIGLVALLCLLAMVGCTAREEEPEAATPEVGTAAAQPATAEAAATSTKELKGTIVRGVCEAPRPPAKGTEGGVAPANVQDSEGGALSTGYGQVTLVLMDITGRELGSWTGLETFQGVLGLDAANLAGEPLPAGCYAIVLRCADLTASTLFVAGPSS